MISCRLLGALACGALLAGAPAVFGLPADRDSEAEELKWNAAKEKACLARCGVVTGDLGEAHRRCSGGCLQRHERKAGAIKDRFAAERSVLAEEKKLKPAASAKGRPGPVAERIKALAAYNRALAILKAAEKMTSGRAGFIGEMRFRGQRLQELQKSCEAQFQRADGQLFVYDPLAAYANQILREYNESLKAPRYGAD